MKVYLDLSVLNRPFDDQFQVRIWLETMAFSIIMQLIEIGEIDLINSSVVAFENHFNPYPERKDWVQRCLALSKEMIRLDFTIIERGKALESKGIKPIDAIHLACAESAKVDFFLTCDDKIVKKSLNEKLRVVNPLEFVQKFTEREIT